MRVASCVHTSSAFAIYAAFFFDPGGRPGPRRRLRRRRTVFVFGAMAFFVCAIFSATAFGGRPGPPGRHFPRRFRCRPFFALFPVETRPSSDWIAERTSCCTMSRITVTRLLCLGIDRLLSGGKMRRYREPCGVTRPERSDHRLERLKGTHPHHVPRRLGLEGHGLLREGVDALVLLGRRL